MLTMNTKAQTPTSFWLLLVLIGLLSQEIHAGMVQQHKQGKPKNSTVTEKHITPSTSKPKYANKSKTITTTTSTTVKPKEDFLTTNSPELELDGRHAYINNEFVSDQEPILSKSPPALYEILQQQMENVLSHTGLQREISNDNPQGKEMIEENANAPAKPLFSYNMNNFNDYDEDSENEQELTELEEQQTENCEDTEESLDESDDEMNAAAAAAAVTQQQNSQTSAQNSKNKKGQPNKPAKGPYDSSNYNSPNHKSQSNKPSTSNNRQKPASKHPEIANPQTSGNQQTYKPSKSHEKLKPTQLNTTASQSPSNDQHKAQAIHKPSKNPSSISHNYPSNPPKQQVVHKPQESYNNPTQPNRSNINGNSNTNLVSPSSTPPSSGSYSGKTPSKRRHLTFRTVSSSTQFVSTPLADLMLKFSIGLATKPSKVGEENNKSQIYDKNVQEIAS